MDVAGATKQGTSSQRPQLNLLRGNGCHPFAFSLVPHHSATLNATAAQQTRYGAASANGAAPGMMLTAAQKSWASRENPIPSKVNAFVGVLWENRVLSAGFRYRPLEAGDSESAPSSMARAG